MPSQLLHHAIQQRTMAWSCERHPSFVFCEWHVVSAGVRGTWGFQQSSIIFPAYEGREGIAAPRKCKVLTQSVVILIGALTDLYRCMTGVGGVKASAASCNHLYRAV